MLISDMISTASFPQNYEWHNDYVRVAKDSGFYFKTQKANSSDRTKISFVDIDRVVKERDFHTIQAIIPTIIEFILDPEETRILDENFVKTFRLGQLAIEYLLFCKKYLDDLVISLQNELTRVNEENKDLQECIEDLKDHVDSLVTELKEKSPLVGFRCEECSKIFSTEEFLKAHKNRRHTSPPDSDRLQFEIKELKGRLNSAEQCLQKDIGASASIMELHRKIDDLRVHVQSELKVIENKQSLDEKYDKLLQKISLQQVNSRREITTQTDYEDIQFPKEQMFVESLERKLSKSLEKIEMQMECVWSKMQEIETTKSAPQIKPRTKFPISNTDLDREVFDVSKTDAMNTLQQIQQPSNEKMSSNESSSENSRLEQSPKITDQVPPSTHLLEKNKVEDLSSESEIEEIPAERPKIMPRQSLSNTNEILEDSISSPNHHLDKTRSVFQLDPQRLAEFGKELEKLIRKRLEDLGVNPDWSGLPENTFQKTLQIVEHQTSLVKKKFPDFDRIRGEIIARMEKEIHKDRSPKRNVLKSRTIKTDNYQISTPTKIFTQEDKENVTGKGVLKVNSPNMQLPPKKKVVFNLDPEPAESSTSITSSVLDVSSSPLERINRSKLLAVLSDSD